MVILAAPFAGEPRDVPGERRLDVQQMNLHRRVVHEFLDDVPQYSFSTDPQLRGAPSGHVINIREVRLAAGAEFVVMVCGDIMTMPGLPKVPSACKIDLDENGKVVGLF